MDAACGRLHQTPPTTRFYVVDGGGGLADAFVQIQAGLKSQQYAPPAAPVVLNQAGCVFEPYVLGLQVGQKLLIRNSDPILHNIHVIPSQDSGDPESNRAQTAGAPEAQHTFNRPDRSMRIKCDVHPWMFAYVSVVEHPFFAVTGADGRYEINNVPPGTFDIVISHRKAGVAVKQVTVKDGEPATLDVELAVP